MMYSSPIKCEDCNGEAHWTDDAWFAKREAHARQSFVCSKHRTFHRFEVEILTECSVGDRHYDRDFTRIPVGCRCTVRALGTTYPLLAYRTPGPCGKCGEPRAKGRERLRCACERATFARHAARQAALLKERAARIAEAKRLDDLISAAWCD